MKTFFNYEIMNKLFYQKDALLVILMQFRTILLPSKHVSYWEENIIGSMLYRFYLQFPLRLPHNKELRELSIKSRLIELFKKLFSIFQQKLWQIIIICKKCNILNILNFYLFSWVLIFFSLPWFYNKLLHLLIFYEQQSW
jgi:hypothetical protein